jgi:hypothetical protein
VVSNFVEKIGKIKPGAVDSGKIIRTGRVGNIVSSKGDLAWIKENYIAQEF